MRTRRSLLVAAALGALAPVLAPPALAQRLEPNPFSRQYQGPPEEQPQILSVREIIERLPRQLGPGRVIGQPYLQSDGRRPVYVVNWLSPDGRSRDVVVDATNGRVLR
ncbi:MAG: PepSY domain-containing protein [Hydrogenophilaceae bacterium]|jgi:hypothetical protein|nr:PepSY domain-containing protein [Hydrogenophilaceae bacterium]